MNIYTFPAILHTGGDVPMAIADHVTVMDERRSSTPDDPAQRITVGARTYLRWYQDAQRRWHYREAEDAC